VYANKLKAYINGAIREIATLDETQEFTNKTLTSPNVNEAVALTSTATELNQLDGVTVGGTSAGDIATINDTQTFTGKTYDADASGNVLTNIEDANIKAGAAIDATKIADGSVTDAEFQRINSLNSNAQTQITANATAVSDHIGDATDAHAGSAIGNTPAGNLAATDVQGALNELQTDVDTRALDSDFDTHVADTTTHGTAGAILGATDTQDISGKTFTDFVQLAEVGAPGTPSSGDYRIYPKTDGNLYGKNDAGTEVVLGVAGTIPDSVIEFRRTGTISAANDTILVDSDTAFTSVTVTQDGTVGLAEITDFVCKADSSGSLNDRVGHLYSASDATHYYIWFNVNSEGTDPSYGGMTGIEVAVATGAADTVVASAVQTAVNGLGDFGASVSTNTVTVTNASVGVTTDASNDAIVLTLPTAVGIEGKKFNFAKVDSSDESFDIDGDGSETAIGESSITIYNQFQTIVLESDNVNFVNLTPYQQAKSGTEKAVGTWIDGKIIYERSYSVTGWTTGNIVDSELTDSFCTPTNEFSKYTSGDWDRTLFCDYATGSVHAYMRVETGGLSYHHIDRPSANFTVQYIKN